VKRHPALVELSREHHAELSQARKLRRAATAPAPQRLAAGRAYVEQFFGPTADHFRREEDVVFPVYARHAGQTELVGRILREHMELNGLARELRAQVAAGEVEPATLDALGTLLHDHVRLEERELFEEIQRVVPSAELDALE
jgi:iron-sulfur cluster repair protein YtfE (RIC family)